MMKKRLFAIAALTLALGISACSSKKDDSVTTSASTEAASEGTDTESTGSAGKEENPQGGNGANDEDVEEDYLTGIITAIDGNILTVKNDDDESEKKYDLSNAQITQEFPFSEGDWVDITFPAGTTEDPVPVIALDVMESVIGQNSDPSAEGTVTEADSGSVTLELEDGESYTFSTSNAYIVAADGITTGKKATVTYIGDIDDEAMAVKVVMEDSYGTPEAAISAFIGEVVQIDDQSIVLESADGDFYTFITDDIDLSNYSNGDTLQIEYTGTVTAKEIPAVSIAPVTDR